MLLPDFENIIFSEIYDRKIHDVATYKRHGHFFAKIACLYFNALNTPATKKKVICITSFSMYNFKEIRQFWHVISKDINNNRERKIIKPPIPFLKSKTIYEFS